jgi:hypothetical protein
MCYRSHSICAERPIFANNLQLYTHLESHYKRLQRFLRGFDCLGDGRLAHLLAGLSGVAPPCLDVLTPSAPRFCPVQSGCPLKGAQSDFGRLLNGGFGTVVASTPIELASKIALYGAWRPGH